VHDVLFRGAGCAADRLRRRSLQKPEKSATLKFFESYSGVDEFRLVIWRKIGTLLSMKFTAYSYWWRFTYRTNRQRGAIV
jgi:hypothetical protein